MNRRSSGPDIGLRNSSAVPVIGAVFLIVLGLLTMYGFALHGTSAPTSIACSPSFLGAETGTADAHTVEIDVEHSALVGHGSARAATTSVEIVPFNQTNVSGDSLGQAASYSHEQHHSHDGAATLCMFVLVLLALLLAPSGSSWLVRRQSLTPLRPFFELHRLSVSRPPSLISLCISRT